MKKLFIILGIFITVACGGVGLTAVDMSRCQGYVITQKLPENSRDRDFYILEKGYSHVDEVETLMTDYERVEGVPDSWND